VIAPTPPRAHPVPRAAPLIAIAVGCVLALPAHLVLDGSGSIDVVIGWFVPVFVVVVVLTTMAACRMRSIADAGLALAGVAVVIGVGLGLGSLQETVVSVIVSVLVAGVVTALADRDWREPADAALVGLTLALAVECLVASGAQRSWAPVLVITVPLVLAASLAGRAAALWFDAADPGPEQDTWFARTSWLAAAAGIVTMAGTLLGGTIDRIGSLLAPVGAWAFSAVVAVLAQVVRPVLWLFDQMHADPEGVRKIIEQLRRNADATRRAVQEQQRTAGSGVGVARVLALVFLMAFVAGVVLIVRRLRSRPSRELGELPAPGSHVEHRALAEDEGGAGDPLEEPRRPPIPRDPVRRTYLEVLDALDARGFHKDPDSTPAEFARAVGDRVPAAAADLAAITDAYERVRYGGASSTRGDAHAMTSHRRSLVRLLPRVIPPEPA
jgi:hypothetical protein